MSETTPNLAWRPVTEIQSELEESDEISFIRLAASLRAFFNGSIFAPDYEADVQWSNFVKLTPAGQIAFEMIEKEVVSDPRDADLKMGLFCLFYHHELLIDCANSDLKGILELLQRELMSQRLQLPHRFGRLLYDKFNDEYQGNRTDHILAEEAWDLLTGTSVGVYQVGYLVSGPLGIAEVGHLRYVPPVRNLQLWHCSAPGCESVHNVDLIRFDVVPQKIIAAGRELLRASMGPESEWGSALPDFLGADIPRQPYTYFDVCTLIADCIVESERTALVAAALANGAGEMLRSYLAQPPRKKAAALGAPEAIALKLSPEEQLQLLWLLSNADLVSLIDKCVAASSIHLPLAEIRTSRNVPPSANRIPACELSALGTRCTSGEPLLDYWSLLWDAYEGSNRVGELDWRLHNTTGASPRSLLLDFLCKTELSSSLGELVLASEPITKVICERICCSLEGIADSRFNDRLLWKLGFDLPRYSEHLQTLRRRLEFFNQELLSVGVLKDERDRERIRSAGVNLFVSIESFLEQLVGYNVWLLASDHFLATKFRYNEDDARRFVAGILGESIGGPTDSLSWTPERTNTLGVSMAYLNVAAKWMRGLLDQSREILERPIDDLPHFADWGLRVFPFRHTALWADCDRSALERFVDGFQSIATKLSRSNLAGIRNGLDHHRREESFPKIDEMLAFVSHLRESVDSADVNRYFPKEFWLNETKEDRFGRETFVFSDYMSRTHTFYGPSYFIGLPGVRIDRPAVVAPGALLGATNSEIVFSVHSNSVVAAYWNGYPRRRLIPNPHRRDGGTDPYDVRAGKIVQEVGETDDTSISGQKADGVQDVKNPIPGDS